MIKRKLLRVYGIVQGVGFRPYVYRIATSLGLRGFVRNDTLGVEIEIEGDEEKIETFKERLRSECPPAASIHRLVEEEIEARGDSNFLILESATGEERETLISPDLATCPDCLRELFDPGDRRFRYPFINCTNCGPRYTIIEDVPYDRPNTTMRKFEMCPECRAEYENPADRRFHAQPNACPVCGPEVWLVNREGEKIRFGDSIRAAARYILEGKIIALKGLGGFHIACDATNDDAVKRLRALKKRGDKPFALMAPDLETVERLCFLNDKERELLTSPRCSILLLEAREDAWKVISRDVAPRNRYIGFMLPYTPLHHLLLRETKRPLVMTSGNLRDEPIVKDNDVALEKLSGIADYFLLHNRDIATRIDDSVARVIDGKEVLIRRARGYVPAPLSLAFTSDKEILALGPMMKSTLCFLRGRRAFLSQYLGDNDIYDNYLYLLEIKERLEKLFGFNPELVVHDLHPDYPTTRLASEMGLPSLAVQHHEAHLASVLAEKGLVDAEVIGVAFDGTGYGRDGRIWGGEFFIGRVGNFERRAHIAYFPLPGGEKAIEEPWRIAFALLKEVLGEEALETPWAVKLRTNHNLEAVLRLAETEKLSPLTSSAGRLFDGVSSLLSIRHRITYEAQAAIELEMAADPKVTDSYEPRFMEDGEDLILDVKALIAEVYDNILRGTPVPMIAAKFHNWLATSVLKFAEFAREERGTDRVVLSGGAFQNRFLLERTLEMLRRKNFQVHFNEKVPTNDGGVSLGQAYTAALLLREGRL
ncbi:MAG: carbamoyltransferase HypF [Candidatus Hydrothermae bacterium]|nr:carbamoyltransferase HypF [Candidatus Hydrothermae bacterium]